MTFGWQAWFLVISVFKTTLQKTRFNSPYTLGTLLLLVAGWPVAISWVSALTTRPLSQNVMQACIAFLLGLGIIQSLRQWRMMPNTPQPSKMGLGFLLLAGAGYAIADFYAVQSMLWISYLALLAGYSWALRGTTFFMRWLPIILFSGFLLPTVNGEIQMAVSLPLQIASTKLAAMAAGLFIPISSSDTLISIGDNALQVTPACSGLQSWIGFLFAGLLWQVFEGSRSRFLLVLIPGALLLSLLLNCIRLTITALITAWVSIDQAVAVHSNLDFILFPIGLFILWMVASRWFRHEKSPVAPSPQPSNSTMAEHSKATLLTAWTSAILFTMLIASHWMLNAPIQTPEPPIQLPMQLAGWTGHTLPLPQDERRAFGSARVISREYTRPSKTTENNDDAPILWMKVLQSRSIGDIHNFYGCLMLRGIRPNILPAIKRQTAQGTLNATIMEFEYDGDWYYTVIWHQWGAQTASNRWQWYRAILTERLNHRAHAWNIVKLVMPKAALNSVQRQQELQTLSDFATSVYMTIANQG